MAGITAATSGDIHGHDWKSQIKVVRTQRGFLREGIHKALNCEGLPEQAIKELEFALRQAEELKDQ
jgi:hypothetical protein